MNLRKRLIAGALAGVMLLMTACAPKDGNDNSKGNEGGQGQNGKGRFVETNVTPENVDGMSTVGKLSDGTLVILSRDMKKRYESTDNGVTWKELEGPAAKNPELEYTETSSLAADGTLYCSVRENQDYNKAPKLYKVSNDGTVTQLKIKDMEDAIEKNGNAGINQMVAISEDKVILDMMGMNNDVMYGSGNEAGEVVMGENADGEVVMGENAAGEVEGIEEGESAGTNSFMTGFNTEQYSGVYNVDSGEKLYDLDMSMTLGSVVSNDKIYLSTYDGKIQVKNIEDGKTITDISQQQANDEMFYTAMPQFACDKNGALFSVGKNGLVSISDTGEEKKVIEGSSYAFNNPQNYIQNLIANDDGSFLVLSSEMMSGTSSLYRYHYDENATYDSSKVLKIWTLEDNSMLRAAVSAFCEKNPDVQVEIEVAKNTQAGAEPADIIRNLNTEILAGKGPDLILLDKLPLENYIKQGILVNLNGKVDVSSLYDAISDSIKTDSGDFYSVPSRFKAPIFMGNKDLLDKADSLESVINEIKAGKDAPDIGDNMEEIFNALPESERPFMSFSEFEEAFNLLWNTSVSEIINENKVDTENLKTMLTALKEVSDKFKLFEEKNSGGGAIAISGGGMDGDILTGGIMDYMSQRALTGAALIGDIFSLTAINGGGNNSYKIFPGVSKGSWIPLSSLGVNAKSDKQDLAVDFINYMISDNVQQISGAGFPVTQSGLKKQEEAYLKMLKDNNMPIDDFSSFDMESLVKELTNPVVTNEFVQEIAADEAELFCKGEQTLENAVSNIEAKTKTYLAEQG